jgi:hypothetical protein
VKPHPDTVASATAVAPLAMPSNFFLSAALIKPLADCVAASVLALPFHSVVVGSL